MLEFDEGVWIASSKVEAFAVRPVEEGFHVEVSTGHAKYERTCDEATKNHLFAELVKHCG